MKINRSIFLLEKKFFLVTILTFYEQCNNRCSLHFNTKLMCFFIKKSIMNFSESRQNRSRQKREKSKNRFFFPPLVCVCVCVCVCVHLYQHRPLSFCGSLPPCWRSCVCKQERIFGVIRGRGKDVKG